nr:uncharacterized protein LOC100060522 [Equus caballus]
MVASGYFSLSIPRILNATVGGTLVVKCQYSVGEEGHAKFWCRGPTWKDCVRVIEMTQAAGQEVRRGQLTLRDRPREHFCHDRAGPGRGRCRHFLVWGGQGHKCPPGPAGSDYFSRLSDSSNEDHRDIAQHGSPGSDQPCVQPRPSCLALPALSGLPVPGPAEGHPLPELLLCCNLVGLPSASPLRAVGSLVQRTCVSHPGDSLSGDTAPGLSA